jgi:aquaporin Z
MKGNLKTQGGCLMKLIAEFVGTFIFLLTIALIVPQNSQFAPLVIGSVLMCMVYMGGHVSGAHYNPAVSLAVMLRGKVSSSDMLTYWGTQIVAGILGFLVGGWITGTTTGIAPDAGVDTAKALVVEIIYTFALCSVVLNVATAKGTSGNSFYGLAIGFTIVIAAFAGGGISGGAFNPAVGIGATVAHAVMDNGGWSDLWLYIAGPFIGAILAAIVFKIMVEDQS